jgi:hypothetical protein
MRDIQTNPTQKGEAWHTAAWVKCWAPRPASGEW